MIRASRSLICCLAIILIVAGSNVVAQDLKSDGEMKQLALRQLNQSLTGEQHQTVRQTLKGFQPRMKDLFEAFVAVAPKPESTDQGIVPLNSQLLSDTKSLFNDIETQLSSILTPNQMELFRSVVHVEENPRAAVKSDKRNSDDSAALSYCNVQDCLYSPYYQEWARYINYLGYTYAYYHYAYETSNTNAYNAYYNALTAGGYIKSSMKYAGPAYFAATYIGNIAYENGECYTTLAFDYANIAEDYAYFAWDYAEETYRAYGGTYGYYSYTYNYYAMLYTDYARDYAYSCQYCCNN